MSSVDALLGLANESAVRPKVLFGLTELAHLAPAHFAGFVPA